MNCGGGGVGGELMILNKKKANETETSSCLRHVTQREFICTKKKPKCFKTLFIVMCAIDLLFPQSVEFISHGKSPMGHDWRGEEEGQKGKLGR